MRPEFLLRSSEGGKLKGSGDERKASEDTISKARSNFLTPINGPSTVQPFPRICQYFIQKFAPFSQD